MTRCIRRQGWVCTQIFEGHSHYVMQVVFNPKDTNTFASASLDRTIKVWSVGSPVPNFTLEGHEKGVNCVDYFSGGDRPYLISGADDKLVKVCYPLAHHWRTTGVMHTRRRCGTIKPRRACRRWKGTRTTWRQ